MNPALPVLLATSLAGLLFRRRPAGVAWTVVGLAGIVLLGSALLRPNGIASPAASLGRLVPWQQAGLDPEAGNPGLGDVTFQIQPWLLFLRGELRQGRLPFWNPHQFAGSPFWANGQSAPLFPLHLLFAALPLQLGFVLLPWLRFVVAGMGAWALARQLGLGLPGALLAGVVFPLSGMLVSFLLFPMGNALALVPWVLLATERLACGASGWPPLALAAGLQLLGGHPETAVHTGMVGGVYLLVRAFGKDLPRLALRYVVAWLVGLGFAAVQLLPLAMNVLASAKWQQFESAGAMPPLPLLLEQLLRLVLPHLYGRPWDGTWWGPFNYSATAVYVGALTLPLAAAGLGGLKTERRFRAVAVVGLLSLWAAYHLPGLRELLGALPVVGRVAHHRLLFAVELTLALLAGRGLDRWQAGKGRAALVAGAAVVGAMLAVAWGLRRADWWEQGLLEDQFAWTAWVVVLGLLAVVSARLSPPWRRRIGPWVPLLLIAELAAAHGGINPALRREQLYPKTGAVGFLRDRAADSPARIAGVGTALRPNAALVYGLADLRGDDPVKLERFEAAYRELAAGDAVFFRPIRHWEDTLLDRFGVRWVVAPPRRPAPVEGWILAWDGADARVWQRPTALPLVRWEDGPGRVVRAVSEPGAWTVDLEAAGQGRLVVAEMWDRGWSATWSATGAAGRSEEVVSLQASEEGFMEVRPPAGEGRLTLRYRPPGILAGLALSGLAGAVLLGAAWRPRRAAEGRGLP